MVESLFFGPEPHVLRAVCMLDRAMLHDEKVYGPNPDQFDPDRFLRPGAVDSSPAFGFGRR